MHTSNKTPPPSLHYITLGKHLQFPCPVLSWTKCRNALVALTLLIAILVGLFIVFDSKFKFHPTKLTFTRRRGGAFGVANSNAIGKRCKQLARKESINWNYFYYYEDLHTKRSLVWCKVPKAASTTLTKMFLRIGGAKDVNNSTRIHKLLRNYYPRLSSKVMKARIKTSKTFLVVRDPFERILSAYRDKLESYERDLEFRDGYYYDHFGRFMVKAENNGTEERKEPTWQEFVQYLLKTSISRYDEHWMPITRLCSPCGVNFDMIIRMENFATDIRKTLNYAKIDYSSLGWSHKTGTLANRKMVNAYFKNLTLVDVKKLYLKYKRDFQLFGYNPFRYFRLFNNQTTKSTRTKDKDSKI